MKIGEVTSGMVVWTRVSGELMRVQTVCEVVQVTPRGLRRRMWRVARLDTGARLPKLRSAAALRLTDAPVGFP